MNLKAVLEGLLFIAGDDGLTLDQIANNLDLSKNDAKKLLLDLKYDYENEKRGIRVTYLGNTFKLATKSEHKEYYQKLIDTNQSKLSLPALEILAIIVYNEPVTRIDIDKIRGVYSGAMIRKLVAKGLIKEIGRSLLPGRPILYKTTNDFFDYFGLSSKEELPKLEIQAESKDKEVDLFLSKYHDQD